MNTKTLRMLVITLVLCMALACGVALAAGPSVCPTCGSPVEVIEPTCGDEGVWICTNGECGDSGTIPPTGNHTWDTDEPTCGDPGQRLCTVCGAYEELPPTGNHTWDTDEPTCGDDGQRLCTVCGAYEVLPATGNHTWDTDEPTCGVDGQRLCTVCGAYEVLPATGNHTFTTYTYNNDETCGADGTETATCDVCGIGTDTRTVPGTATGRHKWDAGKVTTQPTYDAEGVKTYTCTVCGAKRTEAVDKLTRPAQKPSTNDNAAPAAPAATEAPALPYGSIVSDIERADEPYVPETVADETGANTILVITADPDEDGTYTLRNLHITDDLLAQLNTEGILTVRFVVGDATVEFPVASFTGDAVATIKGDLDADVTAFLVTIDPNATTADGQPGVSVGSSVVTTDAAEYDVTPLIPDLTLTIGTSASQPVTTASVYTAAPAEPAVEEAPVEEAPAEEVPAEPAVEEPAVEEPAADEAVAA